MRLGSRKRESASSRISLAECLDEAMRSQRPLEEWFAAEREQGTETIVETVHSVLSEYAPARRSRRGADARRSRPAPRHRLHPAHRRAVSRVPDLLAARAAEGTRHVPTVLFYPGDLDGAAGLRFMGVLDAEHNYRPKIF